MENHNGERRSKGSEEKGREAVRVGANAGRGGKQGKRAAAWGRKDHSA